MALVLIGSFLAGCVATPQQNHAWPWNTKNDYDMKQTGNFIGASVGVVQFGDPPKAVKPVRAESIEPSRGEHAGAESPSAPATSAASVPVDTFSSSSATSTALDKKTANGAEYDFSLKVMGAVSPSYQDTATRYRVIAFNRGMAPVSLAFDIDSPSHQKWAADQPLPLYAVVPPNSEQVVAHLSAKTKYDTGSIRSSYSWVLGDFTASRLSPDQYRFPFPGPVKAFANVPDPGRASPAEKYSVIFVMPVGTPILAARNGTVLRITRGNKVDVLHSDSTIASYEHLGKIDAGISAGSAVSTEDRIGIVGAVGEEKEGYLRLTAWRPEPRPPASPRAGASSPGFDIVSLPMEFCSPNFKPCRVVTRDETVSRSALGEKKHRKSRAANR